MRQVITFFDGFSGSANTSGSHISTYHCDWMCIAGNFLIATAFFAIPFIVFRHIYKNSSSGKFKMVYVLLAAWLIACGITMVSDAIAFFQPAYHINGIVKFSTGIISWCIILALYTALPKALQSKNKKQNVLEEEIRLRKYIEKELQYKNAQLVKAEKIARICYGQWNKKKNAIHLSEEGYSMLGIMPSALSFDDFAAFIHPDDKLSVQEKIDAVFTNHRSVEFYFRIIVENAEKHVYANLQMQVDDYGLNHIVIGTLQDVTEQRIYIEHINEQNEKLKEIAWIQSHLVRGPLATIMGLASILDSNDVSDIETLKALDGIKAASQDLDCIIKEIVSKSSSRNSPLKKNGSYSKVA